MTILDSHVHVWDPEQIPHPWLDDAPPLNRAFLPANIDTAGGRIGEWIFVETDAIAAFARAEADWVAGLDWPGLRGVVAHVEMARGDLEPQLDELQGARLLVGVRPSVQNDPSDIIASAEFAADLRVIGSRGLAFDACVRWHQLDALADAATRAPETRIVLDHLGKPPVLEGLESAQGSAWRRGIERLAELPNVFVKCSGVPAEAGDAFDEVAGVFDRLAGCLRRGSGDVRERLAGLGRGRVRGAGRTCGRCAPRRRERGGVVATRRRHGPSLLWREYI
jgi:L-fuconolactonase